MNKAHLFILAAGLLATTISCTKTQNKETEAETTASVAETAPLTKAEIGNAYTISGDTISPEMAVNVDTLEAALVAHKDGNFTVKSNVESVCVQKGCWMKVTMPSGKKMHVTFKDYAFFVPKDLAGQEVVFSGKAFNDTLDVKTLRHYAEDGGKSKEEIAKITKPEITYQFEATGVLMPKKAETATEEPAKTL